MTQIAGAHKIWPTGGLILPFGGIWPRIAADAFLAPGSTVIGDVEIGARVGVWFNVVIRGDMHSIRIGEGTNIQDGSVVHVTKGLFPTVIGRNVTIGHLALVHGCTLGDHAVVAMKATVGDGAELEPRSMLATGANLPGGKRIPRGQVWSGNPAKFWREVKPEEEARFFDDLPARYAELAQTYCRALAQS